MISQETKMADIIMDNQSAKRGNVSESSDWSAGSYKSSRSQDISYSSAIFLDLHIGAGTLKTT